MQGWKGTGQHSVQYLNGSLMLNVVATLVVDYFVWYCAFWNWMFYTV